MKPKYVKFTAIKSIEPEDPMELQVVEGMPIEAILNIACMDIQYNFNKGVYGIVANKDRVKVLLRNSKGEEVGYREFSLGQ